MSLLWGCDFHGCGALLVILNAESPGLVNTKMDHGWQEFETSQSFTRKQRFHLCPTHAQLAVKGWEMKK